MNAPSQQQLVDDLRAGFQWIKFDLFKKSGKWGYGGWVKLSVNDVKAAQFCGRKLLCLIQNQQNECTCDFDQWFVITNDDHYNEVSAYRGFIKRLWGPTIL